MTAAWDILVQGVVQGVGFRPFVLRLAEANVLAGWVLNDGDGVRIHLEGPEPAMESFVRSLRVDQPAAASISAIDVRTAPPYGCQDFTIRESRLQGRPSVRISPDLPACDLCLEEMFETQVPHGAIYYHATRRRQTVVFDPALRQATIEAISRAQNPERAVAPARA